MAGTAAGTLQSFSWWVRTALTVAVAGWTPPAAHAATFFVTNTNDSGAGSLRQAILNANAATGQDSIQFSISLAPGAVATITPLTPMPDVTDAVSILGYSQAGSVKNSLAAGFNAVLRIRLSGASAGPGASGLVIKAAGVTVDGLIIDGFGGSGVQAVAGAPSSVIVVTGSVLGKGYGTLPLTGNVRGVSVEGAPNARVGGLLAEDRNLIAGNQQEAVLVTGAGSTNTSILGNRIGLNDAGTAEGNRHGVRVTGGSVSIGTHLGSGGNVIAASAEADLQIEAGVFGVHGNRIGTDDAGLANRGSTVGILIIGATSGAIGPPGAPTAAGRNVVVASSRAIELRQSSGVTVANNYICRNASGAAIGTCGRGILVQEGGSHTIGGHYISGTRFSQGNVIANCQVGIELSQTAGNTIEANTIEDNAGAGVLLSSSGDNVIGSLYDTALGGSLGNTIRRNGSGSVLPRGGLVVMSGAGNAILRNGISDNSPVGIDLGGDGETFNDKHDADTGPNNGQNYPALFRVTAGATTQVDGMLASLPSQAYRLQFFRSASLNGSGHAEGQLYLGETIVTTDAADHAFWTVTLPAIGPGAIVTATATRLVGATPVETSEFSPGLTAAAPALPTISAVTPTSGPTAGGTVLTVTGTFFFLTDTIVTIGGTAATDVLVLSPTSLVATTPAHAAGLVDVRVTTSVGSATRAGAFTYAPSGPTDTPLMAALNRLRAASLVALDVDFEKGLPVHVSGLVPAGTPSEAPLTRAMNFLNEYRDLYQIVSDGSVRFRPSRQHVETDGSVHVVLQQVRDNIPVLGADIALHFRGNNFTGSNGRWVSSLSDWYRTSAATSPSISFQAAFERAVLHMGGGAPDPSDLVGKPGLVFYWPELDHDRTWTPSTSFPEPGENIPRLAWRMTSLGPGGMWDYVVDAEDGSILEATTRQRESLDLELFDAQFNTSSICFGSPFSPDHTLWFTEDGRQVREGLLDGDSDGQNGYDFIRETYWYYRDAHDRDSYDNDEGQIEMFVNYGNVANAYANEECLRFGDDWVTRDIVPHEFTHMVTYYTADLAYRRESGAINESMSDVFGALVDDDDWQMGENLLPGDRRACGALRDLSDPPNCSSGNDGDGDGNNDPFPDHVDPAVDAAGIGLWQLAEGVDPGGSNDNGWVHVNSSIPNKAAYLVAAGGTHNGFTITGIGRAAMADIWYRTLTRYLSRRSRFSDLASDAQNAARDLFGEASVERCTVRAAFASVGLGSPDTDCDGLADDDEAENDDDNDFIPDNGDNCPQVPNPDQANTDGVGQGDACDPDADNDGLLNDGDNCPLVSNPGQNDNDGDGIGSVCDDSDADGEMDSTDNCRTTATRDQANHDNDILGDACDANDDNDLFLDGQDNCPIVANNDQLDGDGDGVGDVCDNCPDDANANQANSDGDLFGGDACDGDDDNDNVPDFSDVCPLAFDPQQIDMDRNGRGLRCDSDEAAMLGGDLGWSAFDVPFLTDSPVDIPLFPCVDDGCPGAGEAFVAGQRFTLRLGGTANLDARIVDAAGNVVARGVRGAAGQTLDFEVAPGFGAISGQGGSAPLIAALTGDPLFGRASGAARAGAAATSLADPWAPGPDEPAYFLQLRPLSASVVGQTVHLSVAMALNGTADADADGVADNVDSCVAVPNADQADEDGDGLGDACDNCRTAANGPALAIGTLVAQADADGDATGDVCDLPRYLAEGATSAFFDMRLALANLTDHAQAVTVRYQRADGSTLDVPLTVAAHARATIDPKSSLGTGTSEFSTSVESAGPVLVDRLMSWDARGYGAHAETGVLTASTTWYLAEGATHSGLELFYLLQNPDPRRTAQVEVTFLLPGGRPPLVKQYAVPAHSRFNVWVDTIPELASTDVSAVLTSTNGVPIIVERALYLDGGGRTFNAGHESAGVTAPATEWFLAEGATGSLFDLFVLVANPSSSPARVQARYLLPDGSTIQKQYLVAAQSRYNIWVDYEDVRLADTAVSTIVTSLDDVPIIVERAMWWGPPGAWYEAHNSPGSTATGTVWGMAEGEVGGARGTETYILVANTSRLAANARVTLFFEDGTTSERTFAVAPSSRFNVAVREEFPEARDRRFGARVESLPTATGTARLVVERAMYWSVDGVFWAAGTNALATKLQ